MRKKIRILKGEGAISGFLLLLSLHKKKLKIILWKIKLKDISHF